MQALVQAFVAMLVRAPRWLLLRLSGKPQQVVGDRELLPAFQFLCTMVEKGSAPLETMSPVEARKMQGNMELDPPPAGCRTTDHQIPVGGGEILVREYSPENLNGPAPALVYFHGGGWVLFSPDSHGGLCTRLALRADCRVFSVDYRLAPEHPFPTPLEDAEAAYDWVQSNAERLQVLPERIAAGGDSAGGNLTAALCVSRKAAGKTLPWAQLLLYPVTDMAFETKSFEECGEGFVLTRAGMEWFRGHYAPDAAIWSDPRLSPLRAEDLSGHPPAVVITAGFDPLRDEGDAYAEKLSAADVPVLHKTYDQLIHGFANMAFVPAAEKAVGEIGAMFRQQIRDR
jgi:acetyl esterase